MIKLKHGDFKDCAIRVPYNPQTSIIRLLFLNKTYFFSCVLGNNYEISSVLAKSLSIPDQQEVTIEHAAVKSCSKVEIEAVDEDSWEILSQNTNYVETNFLSQIRVVQKGLVLPLWVHSCCIWIKIVNMEEDWGVLMVNSEILVKPKDRPNRFKGKVLRAAPGGLDFSCEDYPNDSILACILNNTLVIGLNRIAEPCAGHIRGQLLEKFERYKVFQILTCQNNTLCFINKFSGEVKSASGELSVSCKREVFEKAISRHSKLALFDGMCFDFEQSVIRVRVNSQVSSGEWIGFAVVDNCRLVQFQDLEHNKKIEKKTAEIQSFQAFSEKLREFKGFSLMVEGPAGVGKTSIINLFETLSDLDLVSCVVLPCRTFPKKEFSSKLNEAVNKANRSYPSVLIIEDIEICCPKTEDTHSEDFKLQSNQNALALLLSLDSCQYEGKFKIFSTCKSRSSVSSLLTSSHYFTTSLKVPPLSQSDISSIVHNFLPDHSKALPENQLKSFTLLDLIQFCTNTKLMLSADSDFNLMNYLKSFTPSALDTKKTENSACWNDLGGMFKAKKIIYESFTFPVKYRSLYQNYPMRIRSGILLFGPPGCGKTLLASAIPSLCEMSAISVKGPELLNKYIGASEQSIRDLFDKAKRVKPSILVFDEFEAIVPKRGSGISASTDRIVNQFLCELDGVESRENVFIVAVSSRPELIDQALLRPGRLDFHVLCDFPDTDEREDIIKVLGKKLGIDGNFRETAEKMKNFTGADIQGMFNDLQIKLAHKEIEKIGEEEIRKYVECCKASFNDRQVEEFQSRFENFINKKTVEVGKRSSYY